MLGMMGNGNKERGAMMSRDCVMRHIAQELLGATVTEQSVSESPTQLKEHGAAVMRALQAGDVDAFTAGLQRFFIAMEELDDVDEDPFDLEMG